VTANLNASKQRDASAGFAQRTKGFLAPRARYAWATPVAVDPRLLLRKGRGEMPFVRPDEAIAASRN